MVLGHPAAQRLAKLLPRRLDPAMRQPGQCVGIAFTATLLFGLIPAMLASKVDLVGGLKVDTSGAVGGRAPVRAGRGSACAGILAVSGLQWGLQGSAYIPE